MITAITVVYNGEQFLEETILSIINQTYENIEYIVIDGGSTDGTLKIIKKYEHVIDYWVSEKDKGIYDAMNKGIQIATGDIVGLINADDYYASNTMQDVANTYVENKADIIFGNKLMLNQDLQLRKKVCVKIPLKAKDMNIHSVHPTVFVSRNLYKKLIFNVNYKISADYDFLLKVFDDNYKIEKIDKVLSIMRTGGTSGALNFDVFNIKWKRFGLWVACFYLFKLLVKKTLEKIINIIFWTPEKRKRFYLKRGWY